jgi:hypothetical protein
VVLLLVAMLAYDKTFVSSTDVTLDAGAIGNALQKNSDVKVEVVHDRTKLDEWTWGWNGVPFLYSDNTTVNLQPEQNVTFVSVVYQYRWR